MTATVERTIAALLREVRPRPGFSTELLRQLTADVARIYQVEPVPDRPRSRWVVAGAVAGVVSATGVAYLAARRYHHRGAA